MEVRKNTKCHVNISRTMPARPKKHCNMACEYPAKQQTHSSYKITNKSTFVLLLSALIKDFTHNGPHHSLLPHMHLCVC